MSTTSVNRFWEAVCLTVSVNKKWPSLLMLGINGGGYFLCPSQRGFQKVFVNIFCSSMWHRGWCFAQCGSAPHAEQQWWVTGAKKPRKKIRHGEKKLKESDMWVLLMAISNVIRKTSIPSLSIPETKLKIRMDPLCLTKHEIARFILTHKTRIDAYLVSACVLLPYLTHFGRWLRDHGWKCSAVCVSSIVISLIIPLYSPRDGIMWTFDPCS